MQDPRTDLQSALKDAMKSQNTRRRDVIRLVQSAIKQEEVDSRKTLSSDEIIGILQREAKRRRESIADYEKGGRDDLVQQEQEELVIIEEFLPEQLSDAELATIVDDVITKTGATSPKEMGKVMGQVMAQVKGLADGTRVNQIVREKLNT